MSVLDENDSKEGKAKPMKPTTLVHNKMDKGHQYADGGDPYMAQLPLNYVATGHHLPKAHNYKIQQQDRRRNSIIEVEQKIIP